MTHTLGIKNHIDKKPKKFKKFFDKAIYVVAIGGPLMVVPQALKIFLKKNAQSTSILTFTGFFIISLFWIIYGTIHKEKPIIFTNTLFAIIHGIVIAGTIIYQ